MKKFIEVCADISEREYRDVDYISFSKVSSFIKDGPKVLITEKKEENDSLLFGSLFDSLLTEPEEFNNKFYITKLNKIPSQKVMDIIGYLYRDKGVKSIDNNEETVLNACRYYEYYQNYKPETLLRKLEEDGQQFFEEIINANGRYVLDQKMVNDAEECVNEILTNRFTYMYFSDKTNADLFSKDTLEHVYQGKLLDHNRKLKCMIDKAIIDHEKKEIQLIDLKTTAFPEENFQDSYLKYRYDIQASLYPDIVNELYKGYKILPFKFIVINRYHKKPLIYEDHTYHKIISGNIGDYRPYYDWISEMKWHLENNEYDYSYESIKNNGVKQISLIDK